MRMMALNVMIWTIDSGEDLTKNYRRLRAREDEKWRKGKVIIKEYDLIV